MHPVHDRILTFIDEDSPDTFETLALDVFVHQFETVEPYRALCIRRGRTPENIRKWHEIPPVPVRAFKQVDFCCGPPQRIFLSSGTTLGKETRSRHLMPDLRLYERSALGGLQRYFFPDTARIPILSIVPRAESEPYSSLAQMVSWAVESFGTGENPFAVTERGVDIEHCITFLKRREEDGIPCAIMTTTAGLIRLLDLLQERRFRLPHGSRIMDTGGNKGAPRRLSRRGLLHACWRRLGIPSYFLVNEYGMAELSSQFYDSVIVDRFTGNLARRRKVGPPWVRTRVLDPGTLAPVPPGERGLLCHFDLANAGSVLAVLTEDIGRAIGNGFEVLGRAAGAEARGCSLSLQEWEAGRHTG